MAYEMFNPKNRTTLNVTTLTFNIFAISRPILSPHTMRCKKKIREKFPKSSATQREMHLLVGNSLTRHDFHGKGRVLH